MVLQPLKNYLIRIILEGNIQIPNPNYNLRNKKELKMCNVKGFSFGKVVLAFLDLKICDKLPNYLKSLNSKDVKNWVPQDYPCRLWKNYVMNILVSFGKLI